jgi:hypothetical protein
LASGIRNVGAVAAFGSRVAWATWESGAPDPAASKGEGRAMAKTGGDQWSLLEPFVAGSLSADVAGVCATALYAASVVCVEN